MRRALVTISLVMTLGYSQLSYADTPNPGPGQVCAPGQTPGVDCPAPPGGNGGPAQPNPSGSMQPSPAPSSANLLKGSGFTSTFPLDRSVDYFSSLSPTTNPADNFAVSWDSSSRIQFLPYISVEKNGMTAGGREQHLCKDTIEDPTCASPDWTSAFINSTIGNCKEGSGGGCVSSFQIITGDGKVVDAQPLTKFPANAKGFSGAKLGNGSGYPPGHVPWLWRADGDGPGSDHDYLLTGLIFSAGSKMNGQFKISPNSFFFEVVPVTRETSPLLKAPKRVEQINQSGKSTIGFDVYEKNCFAVDDGVCLHRRDFPSGVRLKVTMQMPRNISGWLNGRLFNPVVSVSKKSDQYDELQIEAAPTKNILAGGYVKASTVSSSDWDWVSKWPQNKPSTSVYSAKAMIAGTSNYYVGDSGENGALEWFSAWAKKFGNKALRVNDTWTIQTTQGESTGGCVKENSGLSGIVSTNASVYDPGAPQFDTKELALNYRIAAPEFDPNGKALVGVYALSMGADLLQCLYNVKSIPTQAQIMITQSDGEKIIQTAALTTKNGWVNFAAQNFNFSDLSLLQVKMSTSGKAQPTPQASKSTASTAITITCAKGKTTKKVTGAAPKCPSGYKKV